MLWKLGYNAIMFNKINVLLRQAFAQGVMAENFLVENLHVATAKSFSI